MNNKQIKIVGNGDVIATFGKFSMSRIGLQTTSEPTYDEWLVFMQRAKELDGFTNWIIGDGLNLGEHKWGEKYAQAIDDTQADTWKSYAWVSNKVNLSTRVDKLTWSHHREVAKFEEPEQKHWLGLAKKHGWGVLELKKAIKEYYRAKGKRNTFSPSEKPPTLIVSRAENMSGVKNQSIDVIITSPPYNLGDDNWPMGGDGRTAREGIGYDDAMSESEYHKWQVAVFKELFRVAKDGASLFYNHKPRTVRGRLIHPISWILDNSNPWILRQEIIWDRESTHNHSAQLFWPEDERIYWMTKGSPTLPDEPIGMSTVWTFFGPVPNTWHPAPFCDELPRRCLQATGRSGIMVLDPFAGSCTTLRVALEMGYDAIGIDVNEEYLKTASKENGWGWTNPRKS